MGTKEKLLELLTENPDGYLSGQALAEKLNVSRAAVCKAAKALRDQGYGIHAVTHRGYRLFRNPDSADPQKIRELLTDPAWEIQYFDSLPSTNTLLRELAGQGAPEGTVVLAGSQSAGRGRMGRPFYSPEGTGLYLSILLKPRDLSPGESMQLTTMAAAALCLAIEETTGKKPLIKWVNDLYLDGKKICGILTEASFSMETGMIEDAVLGLGLNLYSPEEGFPQELAPIAGALMEQQEADLKNRLTAAFLNEFGRLFRGHLFEEAAEIYRSRSLLTGKKILVGENTARVLSVNDRCQLVVEFPDGQQQSLSYGEVTIVNPL